MKALNIISSAYRGTLEEQDDTIVWITQAMRGAGAEIDVLLRGAAVNYAFSGQEVSPLSFGARTQSHAPDVHGEVGRLIAGGARVYVMEEDVMRRGLDPKRMLDGMQILAAANLAGFVAGHDTVWNW
jgi:hypothetical protein